ncbi:Gfo/Idh/MocA family protein [Acuticoccus mangrovi]|uniref:Gfo/Idh/MocA family oxidoreductase n=1 Tax=Acuticoccus mangrovi TaxID=2796142 RepID=A0A934IUC1_9HYPH|nr:Gfo/Idh/MocA family oxidoreductase [Acuticoccus mangrovi]MBJ3778748.1 Gfo/Idh/MocA family oxidoreductase [Acuticoccus mangrovi]
MSLKVGIIGFGKMGRIRSETLAARGAQIVRVFDIHYPDVVPYPKAPSWQDIVQDDAIDAVVISMPNRFNMAIATAALKAGKHVLCEKPPCFNAAEMEQIIEVEKRCDKVLMYGFNHRHHQSVIKLKELVSSQRFGRILWMRGRYGKSVDKSYLSTWRADPAMAGGGILIDQGIHMLDLFQYIAECEFDEVHAMVSNMYWKMPGIEDNVFALLRNSRSGLSVSFHSTMTQWRHLFSLEVFLERGYIVLNGLKTSSNSYGEEELTWAKNRSVAPAATWEDEERMVFSTDSSWDSEAEMFLRSVLDGAPVEYGSSLQALQVMRLIDTIYEVDRHQSTTVYDDLLTIES